MVICVGILGRIIDGYFCPLVDVHKVRSFVNDI